MKLTEEEKQDNGWPLPTFNFKVEIGNLGVITFKEVFGLEEEQVMENKSENRQDIPSTHVPGSWKTKRVIMRKGTFPCNERIFAWLDTFKLHIIQREQVVITLLDECGGPAMVWKLRNAHLIRLAGVTSRQNGGEVLIEELELAHEGLTIENA